MPRVVTLETWSKWLSDFQASDETFARMAMEPGDADNSVASICVLDSSFNPPNRAHMDLCRNMAKQNNHKKALLLLLAVENADKREKPASFPHRLSMMQLLAQELEPEFAHVDVCVTKHALFADKFADVSRAFPHAQSQVYAMGFDTLIRLLDVKYYSSSSNASASMKTKLGPFFAQCRVLVVPRIGSWGSMEVQQQYLRDLAAGQIPGADPHWSESIVMHNVPDEMSDTSSTSARKAILLGDKAAMKKLMPDSVAAYVDPDMWKE